MTSDGGGASGATVKYEYYGPTENTGGASAGALHTVKVVMGAQVLSEKV